MIVYEVAALIELALVVLESTGYAHLRTLPLGGGQIQQIGIIFATAHVVAKSLEIFRRPKRK